MEEKRYRDYNHKFCEVRSNNLVRWLVSRSYFYTSRSKSEDGFVNYFVKSHLLDELLEIYEKEKECGKHRTYVNKDSKKAK